MKKMILLATLFVAFALNAQSQAVFKEIYNSSNKVLNDTHEDVGVRKIALFKVDVLTYLNTKTLEALSDSTVELSNEDLAHLLAQRDSQAYYMYDYLNLFVQQYSRAQKERDKAAVLKMFRDASINYPLYNDPNREFVLAYYNREDFLTQFSLDTDWIKANADVRKRLKEAK